MNESKQPLKKLITVSLMRKLEQQVNAGEISYSRMVEILNEQFQPHPPAELDQFIIDEKEQATKRGGLEYAKGYCEGINEGYQFAIASGNGVNKKPDENLENWANITARAYFKDCFADSDDYCGNDVDVLKDLLIEVYNIGKNEPNNKVNIEQLLPDDAWIKNESDPSNFVGDEDHRIFKRGLECMRLEVKQRLKDLIFKDLTK